MIQKVEMYQAVCDGCGKKCQRVWATRESASIDAFCNRWYKIDGRLYCPDCVERDEETDSYKPKDKERNKQ